MEIIYVLSIFYIGTALGAPTKTPKTPTLYEMVRNVCPKIDNDTNMDSLKILNNCENLELLEKQAKKSDLLCLLFYNTYITYCNQTETMNITKLTREIYTRYNLSTICDNVAILTDLPQTLVANESLEKLKKSIDSKEKCVEICMRKDLLFEVEPVCSLSYYYGHSIKHDAINKIKSKKIESNQPQIQSADSRKTPSAELKKSERKEINPTELEPNQQETQLTEDKNSKLEKVQTNQIDSTTLKPNQQKSQSEEEKKLKLGIENTQKNKPDSIIEPHQQQKELQQDKKLDVASEKPQRNELDSQQNSPPTKAIANTKTPKTPIAVENKETVEKQKLSDNAVLQTDDAKSDPIVKHIETAEKNNIESSTVKKADIGGALENGGIIEQPQQIDDFEIKGPEEEQQQQQNEDFISEEDDDADPVDDVPKILNNKPKENNKPNSIDESQAIDYTTEMEGDSYFFSYFMMLCLIFIVGYICYHNKQKILALILEGRRGKRQYRSRRPNSANYHKLDSNLEEAITSSCNKNASNVIY